jgi:hypothetical protein
MFKNPRKITPTNDVSKDTFVRVIKGEPPVNYVVSIDSLFNDLDVKTGIDKKFSDFVLSENINKNSIVQILDNGEIENIKKNWKIF